MSSQLFETTLSVPQKKQKKKLNKLPENNDQAKNDRAVSLGRFPSWLHRKLPKGGQLWKTHGVLEGQRLNTVCEEAKCPNLPECYSKKTATFLVMGKDCTRACGFCDIDTLKQPPALEADEPNRVAESVRQLGLKHVVITMVARDDVEDGGALHLAKIIEAVRESSKDLTIEVLTSDFEGNTEAFDRVLAAKPEVFNHNIETVLRLTPRVRHKATYQRTLDLLSYVKEHGHPEMRVKSGLMLGLGEEVEEVHGALHDLKAVGVDIVTMGQYLQPNPRKLRVKEFVHPDQFKAYENYGLKIGIQEMFCGPFVRSSYHAGEVLEKTKL